jgi:hypothetical protein
MKNATISAQVKLTIGMLLMAGVCAIATSSSVFSQVSPPPAATPYVSLGAVAAGTPGATQAWFIDPTTKRVINCRVGPNNVVPYCTAAPIPQ